MKINSTYLAIGSIHLRLVKKSDANKKYPPYSRHTVLEPKGNGLVELKGLTGNVPKDLYKLVFDTARKHGFKELEVYRVKNDELIRKVYKL